MVKITSIPENENIRISFQTTAEDDLVNDAKPSTLISVFQENIPDDALCVSWKLNVILDPSGCLTEDDIKLCKNINRYMLEITDGDIYGQTCGIHVQGKRCLPHVHLHYIIKENAVWNKSGGGSNPSSHRKKYFEKKSWAYPDKKGTLEMKPQALKTDAPKYQFLAYPLKEGKYIYSKQLFQWETEEMSLEMRNFLLEYAQQLFSVKLAKDKREEMAEERRELKFEEMREISKKYNGSKNYREFEDFMYDNYAVPYMEKNDTFPNVKNYNDNLQRCAVLTRKFKPYECK